MAGFWKRLFVREKKAAALSPPPTEPAILLPGILERVIEEQAAFEKAHPIPFAIDQRIAAMVKRATLINRGEVPSPAIVDLIEQAARDWNAAKKAAREVR